VGGGNGSGVNARDLDDRFMVNTRVVCHIIRRQNYHIQNRYTDRYSMLPYSRAGRSPVSMADKRERSRATGVTRMAFSRPRTIRGALSRIVGSVPLGKTAVRESG
jgi:hypothetical protein